MRFDPWSVQRRVLGVTGCLWLAACPADPVIEPGGDSSSESSDAGTEEHSHDEAAADGEHSHDEAATGSTVAATDDAVVIDIDADAAQQVIDDLEAVGIDLEDVGRTLETEGVDKFNASFEHLIGSLDTKAQALAAS